MLITKQTNVIIFGFIVICICMILFEIVQALKMKYRDRRINKLVNNKNTVVKFLSKPRLLKNETNLLAFELCLDKENKEDLSAYYGHLPIVEKVFTDLIIKNKIKDDIVKSYVVYLATKYKLFYLSSDDVIKQELIFMVGDSNVYVRENALRCIYGIGDTNLVLKALFTLQNRGIKHNQKLLHDGLLDFAGNKQGLTDLLLENFDNFNLDLQLTLTIYFRYQTDKFKRNAYACLKDETKDIELRLSALRYLHKYPYKTALPYIIKLAKTDSSIWEYRAIAAFCLSSYPGVDSVKTLKGMLKDPIWHVRKNAAESLIKINITKRDIKDVLKGDDEYAKQQLQYKLDVEALKAEVNGK